MVNVESLNKYVGTISLVDFTILTTKIYMIIESVCYEYPNYKEWFFTKQLPETINGDKRDILFVRNPDNYDEIVSIACLKKDEEEHKICTIYVSDKSRKLGIGNTIIEESLKWLGTTKPFITFSDYKLELFIPIIEKYGWELTEVVSELYNSKSKELCFNGTLSKNVDLKQQYIKK